MFKSVIPILLLGALVTADPFCDDPNEFLSDCGLCGTDDCPTRESIKAGEPENCPAICQPECVCNFGFKRLNGECVPEDKCPNPCDGENEAYTSCGPGCPDGEVCPFQQQFFCPAVCRPGCFCRTGYYRDRVNGTCIPESKCPCKDNEIYYDCKPYDNCGDDQCDAQRDPNYTCWSSDECFSGCACNKEKGYRRDLKGNCVPISDCPADNCPDNEYLSSCGPSCLNNELCYNLRDPDQACTDNCVEKCVCSWGYARNASGICVPERECPCAKFEKNYTCKPYDDCGDDRCDALRDPNYDCFNIICPQGCACDFEGGYRRDASGVCVPIEECPDSCPKNEFLSTCASGCPNEGLCPSLRKSDEVCDWGCVQQCVCSQNYYRNETGDCVPENECPCRENEDYYICIDDVYDDCGDDRCEALQDPNYRCQNPICPAGCACADGFRRDENKNCIPIEGCPKLCPKNEYLVDGKCVCSEGYFRCDSGECVQHI